MWHLIPHEWNEEGGWVTGSPSDGDISGLSAEDRSLLLGERHDSEQFEDFKGKVESALREQMKGIMSKVQSVFLTARDQQFKAELELRNG